MNTLFTYCIPIDDGAAPNPFWGLCTLVICKPRIRRVAKEGDWVAGTGSKKSPIGDIGGKVVYAMRVSRTMTMQEYDKFTRENLPQKIPDWGNSDFRRRLGDSIYEFSSNPPGIRQGVHNEGNRDKDLKGARALLSDHFFYFGDCPVGLPADLHQIVNPGQGHRSRSNDSFFARFTQWLQSLGYTPNQLHGKVQMDLFRNPSLKESCARGRCEQADEDEKLPDDC